MLVCRRPEAFRRLGVVMLGAVALAGLAEPARAGEAVEIVNASRATSCAEEDNIYVKLVGSGISRFRLAVRHPSYIGEMAEDSTAPDFSHCDMSHDPSFPFTPRDVVVFDDGRYRLVGHAYKMNWRPSVVPLRVGGHEEDGLHLLQLLKYVDGTAIEIVVLYPADGYWRAKPLPPAGRPETGYGSSFLIGPIAEAGRPLVAISAIDFDPEHLVFTLRFEDGGTGTLTLAEARRDELDLDIALTPGSTGDRPFAALRSMFVTPLQADVSEASWRSGQSETVTRPIMDLKTVTASQVRFGRTTKSRHNLSAPDYVFEDFSR